MGMTGWKLSGSLMCSRKLSDLKRLKVLSIA